MLRLWVLQVMMLSNECLEIYRSEAEGFLSSFIELQTKLFYTNEELSIHASGFWSRPEFNLRTQQSLRYHQQNLLTWIQSQLQIQKMKKTVSKHSHHPGSFQGTYCCCSYSTCSLMKRTPDSRADNLSLSSSTKILFKKRKSWWFLAS